MPCSPLYFRKNSIKVKEHLKHFKPTYIDVDGNLYKPEALPNEYLEHYIYKRELIKNGGILYIKPKEV